MKPSQFRGVALTLLLTACSSPSSTAKIDSTPDPGTLRAPPSDLDAVQASEPAIGTLDEIEADSPRRPLTSEPLPTPPAGVFFVSQIAACSLVAGRFDVFAVSAQGAIWHIGYERSTWSDWEVVAPAGTTDTGVAASTRGSSVIDLFYRDAASGRLGHAQLDDDGEWGQERVGASQISAYTPAAASWDEDRIDVFTRGANDELLHLWKTDEWRSDWANEGGVTGLGSAPAVVARSGQRLDVFWSRQGTQALGHWWQNDEGSGADVLDGDPVAGAPTATSRGAESLDVFYASASNLDTLARQYFAEGWSSSGFSLAEEVSVAAVSWGPGRVDLLYLDAQGAIHHALVPGHNVHTQHDDVARTGGSRHEIDLNLANVASDDFGQLFTIPVDGNVWAQPLYHSALDLTAQGQGIRNALYVATGNDTVYLFDADTGDELKSVSLGFAVPVPYGDFTTGSGRTTEGSVCRFNMLPQVGITSTPVLDPSSNTLYVVALTADGPLEPEPIAACSAPATPAHEYKVQLHALDSRTLAEREGSPVDVNPTSEFGGRTIQFQANRQLQRPSLLLSMGKLYLAFGSYTDRTPYYGWVVSYDARTLAEQNVFVSTPEAAARSSGGLGGIWQSGQGPASDGQSNVYVVTGNSIPGLSPYGNAVVELSPSLDVVSHFKPANASALDRGDLDLSSTGVVVVPHTNFVVSGGKEGVLYAMSRSALGGTGEAADEPAFEKLMAIADDACSVENGGISNIHGTPVYWKAESGSRSLYMMGEADYLRRLELNPDTGELSLTGQSDVRAPCGMPGGFLTVSSDADNPRTAIVWANMPTADAVASIPSASFYAFNAETLETLYSDSSRTLPGSAAKFAKYVAPTVANGRVYQAAFGAADESLGAVNAKFSGSVVVYGLKSK